MELAARILGMIIASAMTSAVGYLSFGGSGSSQAGPTVIAPAKVAVQARSQFRSVRSALNQRPRVRNVAVYRRNMARKSHVARRNYRRWRRSRHFKVKRIKLRYNTIRFRTR